MSAQPVPPESAAPERRFVPPEAWADTLTVRSYEVGRDGAVRPGVILRYLENLATRASAGLGFDNRWYRERNAAWVVREMALLLGAQAAIDDELRLYTWVSEFRRVQATRDYLIVRGDSGRVVARAQARWAYIDRATGQLARIPEALVSRMGPWGYAMRPRRRPHPPALSPDGRGRSGRLDLVAREYEADTQGHINNCVYLDWLDEAARQTLPQPARPRYVWLEYLRSALPGDALTIQTAPLVSRSRGRGLWQWMAPTAAGANTPPIVRAWSEWLLTPSSSNSSASGPLV